MKLRLLDLFSGIGGFSLGLERTRGFETVAFCEMKPHARAVLAKNFPGIPCHDDVTTYEFREGEADVITAGFPCQDISFAGEGAGLAGSRSGLYREVIRAIRVVRPLRAVLENVAALLSRGLGTVLGDLATIGYDAEWHCIPASAVGAPHRRDRIWIVANAQCGEGRERFDTDVLRRRQGEAEQTGMGSISPLSGFLASTLADAGCGGFGTDDRLGQNPSEAGPYQGEGHQREWLRPVTGGGCASVADTDLPEGTRQRQHGGQVLPDQETIRLGGSGEHVADANGARLSLAWPQSNGEDWQQGGGVPSAGGWWATEPDVGRVAHGVPSRVDRLAELGNAVVPQIPELIGNAILTSLSDRVA